MFHLLLAVIYLSFISLGLPDGLLGAAWPTIYPQFDVPVSYAGIVSTIIAAGTVVSSLMSDRLTFKLGTGRITALSVAMTAFALLGFSFSDSFWQLCLWAIPYGLGAGSVDASINNYVALHYPSRHMSWLHCMWGVGAATGPYVMGFVLAGGQDWHNGYLYIGLFQILLTAILLFSLPLWKKRTPDTGSADPDSVVKPLALSDVIKIPGAKEVMITFFCYCALEATAGLWASSYLAIHRGISAETAAFFASLFYLGITIGRALNGFLTLKFNDTRLIRLGIVIIAVGIAALLIPGPQLLALAGLIVIGLGCAPIYPCVIHSTPEHFGADKSQALIGVQMASAYVGTCVMPPLFGLIANHITVALFPLYLLIILVLMLVMHEKLIRICDKH